MKQFHNLVKTSWKISSFKIAVQDWSGVNTFDRLVWQQFHWNWAAIAVDAKLPCFLCASQISSFAHDEEFAWILVGIFHFDSSSIPCFNLSSSFHTLHHDMNHLLPSNLWKSQQLSWIKNYSNLKNNYSSPHMSFDSYCRWLWTGLSTQIWFLLFFYTSFTCFFSLTWLRSWWWSLSRSRSWLIMIKIEYK